MVKLIGDAVMFVTPEPADAVAFALDLVATLAVQPVLPDARAAVATGLVTLRDGDYFGPVVNLAARLVHVAEPGRVVVPEPLTVGLDPTRFVTMFAGTHELRGFGAPVDVWRVTRTWLAPAMSRRWNVNVAAATRMTALTKTQTTGNAGDRFACGLVEGS